MRIAMFDHLVYAAGESLQLGGISSAATSRLIGAVCRAITKWSISGSEKTPLWRRGLELGESNEGVVLCQPGAAVL